MNVEKTMEFILENLGDVAVKQARSERQIHSIQNLLKIGMRQLVNLTAAQKRTDQAVREMAVSVRELAASQKRTDARFQRWLDRGSNGKSR
jgi:hypothetical protein